MHSDQSAKQACRFFMLGWWGYTHPGREHEPFPSPELEASYWRGWKAAHDADRRHIVYQHQEASPV